MVVILWRWFVRGAAENVSKSLSRHDNPVSVHLLDTDILIDFLRGRAEARPLLGRYHGAADPPDTLHLIPLLLCGEGSNPSSLE